MKTKFSFSKNHASLLVAMVMLLLLSARSTTFAASATWDLNPADGFWNNNSNWSAAFPNGGSDVATFGVSNTTGVEISQMIGVAGITFNSGASAFTITIGAPTGFFGIFGTGITNSSGITQNFVTAASVGVIEFFNSATAGSMTAFTNNGSTAFGTPPGQTVFVDSSHADHGTFTNNGGTVSGAGGGITEFDNSSHADSATLIANGGTAAGAFGGSILFRDNSTGGTASVDVRNNGTGQAGRLDISAETKTVSNPTGNVTIGSLEGSGNVFLGANNLTVGSNNLSKTFSGVIQNGGVFGGTGGSLTKIGTGALTLTGANTYTGGTTVNAGSLFVNNTGGLSGTGTGAVTVNGGTLGGGNGAIAGTISGAVTINSGATLAPGPTGNGSTGFLSIGNLTLASGSNFSVDLEGPFAGTSYDQVFVTGTVSIEMANLALNLVSGLSVGEHLFIVESTGAVTGEFVGHPDGTTFTKDGVTFTIDYYPSGILGGNVELTVDSVTAVPEPSSYVGALFGLVGLCWYQRRRFAQMFASRVKANSVVAV